MSDQEGSKDLGRLNSLLSGYQKKSLNISKKENKREPTPPPSPVDSESEGHISGDEDGDESQTREKEREREMDVSQDSSENIEEVEENENLNISEFSTDFPDELPDVPSFNDKIIAPVLNISAGRPDNLAQPRGVSMQMQVQPTNVQHKQLRVIHKKAGIDNRRITPLTVLTYNMWMNKHDFVNRIHHLIKIILTGHKYLPDLICFQEVTPEAYQILQQGLAKNYLLFEIFGDPPVPYANLIAINQNTMDIVDENLGYYDLPNTQMSRKVMICHVMVKKTGTKFHIINTHLESFDTNWKNRHEQMEFIEQMIQDEKVESFILTGDFNICSDDEPIESLIRQYGFSDTWIEVGSPQSLKYTFDAKSNPYAKGEHQSRLDRILYRFGTSDRVAITKLKLVGTRAPFPSDHFGLLAEFLVKRTKTI